MAESNSTQAEPKEQTKILGKPIDRVDGRAKVTGQARYAADQPVKDLAYAVAFQSTIAKGRVKSFDAKQAEAQPGVIAILTCQNAPKLFRVSMNHDPGKPGQTYLPLQDDQVHYAGQYVGLVIAQTFAQARDAAAMVKVEYEAQKPLIAMEDAMNEQFVPSKMGRGDKPMYKRGDPDAAMNSAAVKIDQTYITPQENHNPMELSGTIAKWDGDKLTLYNATQFVYGSRSIVSTWLGIPETNVHVIDPFVGGGFGCKGSTWPHEVLAAVAAKHVKRPVKFVLTRQQMFTCVGYRPRTIQRVALGADEQGKLQAIVHECTSPTSPWKDEWVETATKQTRMLYSCANVRTSQKLVAVNNNTPVQMRAPGHATGTFALEVALDELAYAAKVDPIELRLRNYAERDEEEEMPWSSKALRECYKQGAERIGWSKRNPQVGSMRNGNLLIGYGMATALYPTNQQEASVKIEIKADGSATVSTAAHDLGTGAYTVLTQAAAETLGIPVERITTKLGDSDLPMSPVAGGSQTTASSGSAVKMAALKAVASLKERAGADPKSPLFKKQAKEIDVGDGRIFVKGDPSKGETIAELLQRNGGRPIEGKADVTPPSRPGDANQSAGGSTNKEKFSKNAWGAQFVEVHIDPQLGKIRVPRLVGAFAAGKILNAKTAHSQIMGGIVWGLSMGLFEHTVHDPVRAKVVNDNLADYLVPVNPDVQTIDCFFVDEPDKEVNPIGAKGIGEIGITGVAAAISNAVYHATGKRIRELPITLEKLMA
jgi:xanthine dehydrogenase YagR molybdenum-binding subunit